MNGNSYFNRQKSKVLLGVDVFIAHNAIVIGDVKIGDSSSVWFNAVIRGDLASIDIGTGTNIQDGSILHVDTGVPLKIGDYTTIGHAVIVHGAEIGNGCLIGMGATIMNRSIIGERCIIGAKTLITENKIIPPGSLVMGSPGKIIRTLSVEEKEGIQKGVKSYIREAARYLSGNE